MSAHPRSITLGGGRAHVFGGGRAHMTFGPGSLAGEGSEQKRFISEMTQLRWRGGGGGGGRSAATGGASEESYAGIKGGRGGQFLAVVACSSCGGEFGGELSGSSLLGPSPFLTCSSSSSFLTC